MSLPFPINDYWVVMGAALVMHNVKEVTHDLDLGCTFTLFNSLVALGFVPKISQSGRQRVDYSEIVHFYLEWPVDSLESIDGIQVASLQSVINDKRLLGRDKDLYDIQLIEAFLKGMK